VKIGLFFGSFNPVHIGHMVIANYMLEYSDLHQIWFVISPHNPLKDKSTLLTDHHRYELVLRAIDDHPKYRASNIEFSLPKPSYTIHTLAYLQDKYPSHEFVVIMGSDSLLTFENWMNYKHILNSFSIFVYKRPNYATSNYDNHPNVKIFDAPMMEVSSSFIRKAIKEKKDIHFFMPKAAYIYMKEMHFYE